MSVSRQFADAAGGNLNRQARRGRGALLPAVRALVAQLDQNDAGGDSLAAQRDRRDDSLSEQKQRLSQRQGVQLFQSQRAAADQAVRRAEQERRRTPIQQQSGSAASAAASGGVRGGAASTRGKYSTVQHTHHTRRRAQRRATQNTHLDALFGLRPSILFFFVC